MERQIARIERLVNDLSELNRIETGRARAGDGGRSNLRDMLRRALRRLPGADRAAVRFTVDGDDAVANIDPPRAQQIFANLLDNACKHGGARARS